MNEGGDSEDGVDGRADGDGVGGSEDRAARGDAVARGGSDDASDGGDGDAGRESWSAAAPTESDGEIPLPWTVVDAEELEEEVPEEFEELRFVGPKTAEALGDSDVDVEDLVRKRVSYRDLTERGVHPGVAAKIRREHSLSWSFDSTDSDLSRRSSQVRGLDDEERAWVAASSGWGEADSPAETDGSGDAARAESAWQTRSVDGERETAATGGAETSRDEESATDGESAWRETAASSSGDDDPTRDEEAAWRAKAAASGDRTDERDAEAAWRDRAGGSGDAADSAESAAPDAADTLTDAEAEWRERSAPTPVTVLDDVDDDYADRLADAGIRSVRRLATADPESVADALELDLPRVERWVEAARSTLD